MAEKIADKQRRRIRGQFFTPEHVAVFAWRMLTKIIPPAAFKQMRVIDPAAGEGIFLASGIALGLISPAQATGVEIDSRLRPPAELASRWVYADGLLSDPRLPPGTFELVIGNPPFGRGGKEGFCRALARDDRERVGWLLGDGFLPKRERDYFSRLPVEALFVRRFLVLCRPGGYGAVILPDGYLANQRLQREREEFCQRAALIAVIGLPPGTFRSGGTPARTALVFFRRKEEPRGEKEEKGETLFGSMEYCGMKDSAAYFPAVLRVLTDGGKKVSPGVTWVKREDLSRQRWHPNFWDPALTGALAEVAFPLSPLANYIEKISYGPILPGKKPLPQKNGVPVFGQKDLFPTGTNPRPALRVAPGGEFDPERSRVRRGDLLFSRSGEGSLLRFRSGVYLGEEPANVSCFVDRIRLRNIDPLFVWIFLMGKFGRVQILRIKNGVGTPNINFAEIKSLRVPLVPERVQKAVAGIYLREIFPLHCRLAGGGASSPQYALLQRKMSRLIACLDAFLVKKDKKEEEFCALWKAASWHTVE